MLGKAICGAGIDGETEESSRNSSDDRPAENNKRGIIRSSPNDASPTSPNKYIKIDGALGKSFTGLFMLFVNWTMSLLNFMSK